MIIQLAKYPVYICDEALQHLNKFISSKKYSTIFLLVDENTYTYCYPLVTKLLPAHAVIRMLPGEEHKKYETCNLIWIELAGEQADRKSLLINLGGGMVGDVGGFCAGLYMRGIDFIQVPTSLMAQADACIGGKTGIDFFNHKNMIGLFTDPQAVFIYPGFLKTLPEREVLSGFAEVIKHYLIADKNEFEKLIKKKTIPINWTETITRSINIKSAITERDPLECNLRKALNFGHTVGHAIESAFLEEGVSILLHGEAVAAGMICESFLSAEKKMLDKTSLDKIITCIKSFFQLPVLDEKRMESVLDFIRNDKKNEYHKILCTLLDGIGGFSINNEISRDELFLSMRYYNSIIQ